jgi:hypothetical protein
MRAIRIVTLAGVAIALWLGAARSLCAAARQDPDRDKPAARAAKGSDAIDAALEKRIQGKASLDDVRIDASWSPASEHSSIRIYGNGVVICDGKLQFSVKRADVISILTALRKSGFGSMPAYFGEGEEGERNEGPRLKGRVDVRAGSISKSVLQLVDGEQSKELEALAGKVLDVCHGATQLGTGAESFADGFQKLTSGALAPEVLGITLQRLVKKPDEGAGHVGWILELEGRRVTDTLMPVGKMPPPKKLLVLSDADFKNLVRLLSDEHAGELPINVYASEYTDLNLSLFNRSRVISGRRFLQMTPESLGEKQKAFERIYESFRALHERAQKEGKTVRPPAPPSASSKESSERERERETRKPSVTPSSR